MNFRPEGHETLREFFTTKAPKTDIEQVLVVTYYIQNMMETFPVTPSHIRTALNDVSKSIPTDLRQTMRNMKSQKVWITFTDVNEGVQITTQGSNHVQHDMGVKAD